MPTINIGGVKFEANAKDMALILKESRQVLLGGILKGEVRRKLKLSWTDKQTRPISCYHQLKKKLSFD